MTATVTCGERCTAHLTLKLKLGHKQVTAGTATARFTGTHKVRVALTKTARKALKRVHGKIAFTVVPGPWPTPAGTRPGCARSTERCASPTRRISVDGCRMLVRRPPVRRLNVR